MAIKTKKQWDGSGKNLTTFLQVGDMVDESMADYFIEVMFPATMNSRCIQIGETYSHDRNGRPQYMTIEDHGSGWFYAGIKVKPEKSGAFSSREV